MTATSFDLSRPDAALQSATDFWHTTNIKATWALCAARFYAREWPVMAIPGYSTTYTGVWPQVTQAETYSTTPQNSYIRISITYNGSDISNVGWEYRLDADPYTALGDAQNMPLAKDEFGRGPWCDPSRPAMVSTIGSNATADLKAEDSQLRESYLALLAFVLMQDHDRSHWGYVPGTFVSASTVDSNGWLTFIDLLVTIGNATKFRYQFTYYDPDDYQLSSQGPPAPQVLRRTVEISVQRTIAEGFITLEKLLYIRRGNGSVSRIVRQGAFAPSNPV